MEESKHERENQFQESTDPRAAAGENHSSCDNETAMWEEQKDKSAETMKHMRH